MRRRLYALEKVSDESRLRFDYGLELNFHVPMGIENRQSWEYYERVIGKGLKHYSRGYTDLDDLDFKEMAGGDLCAHLTKGLRLFAKTNGMRGGSPGCSIDGEEIEVQSPLIGNLRDLRLYYDYVTEMVKPLKGKPSHAKTISGGGDLHVTLKGRKAWDDKFIHEVRRDLNTRPYLNWVFNDPDDNCNAGLVRPAFFSARYIDGWHDPNNDSDVSPGYDSKGQALSVGLGQHGIYTMQFRVFEAPHNYAEQVLHIQFIDHYLDWMLKRWQAGYRMPPRFKSGDLEEIPYEWALYEFNRLLSDLKLNRYDYKVFIRRNLNVRYKYDKERN